MWVVWNCFKGVGVGVEFYKGVFDLGFVESSSKEIKSGRIESLKASTKSLTFFFLRLIFFLKKSSEK